MKPEKTLNYLKTHTLREIENIRSLFLSFFYGFGVSLIFFVLNFIKDIIDQEKIIGDLFVIFFALIVFVILHIENLKYKSILEYKKKRIDKREKDKALKYIEEFENDI